MPDKVCKKNVGNALSRFFRYHRITRGAESLKVYWYAEGFICNYPSVLYGESDAYMTCPMLLPTAYCVHDL